MNKIGILIGNEILKLRRRKTLLVMLIILLVVCLGYQFLMGTVLENLTEIITGEDAEYSLRKNAEDMLKDLEERGGADATDPNDRQNWFFYSAVLEYDIDTDDWRFESGLLSDWADAKAQENPGADALGELLDQNDYKEYYKYLIRQNEVAIMDSRLAEAANWGYDYCLKNDIKPTNGEWRYETAKAAASAKYQKITYDIRKETTGIETDPALYEEAENTFALAEYQLKNNIEVNPADSFKSNPLVGAVLGNGATTSKFWDALASGGNTLVGIFMIVIAGSIVAGEFQKGTIKFLLLTPAKRWKILLAKYCAVLITGLFFLAVSWVANLIFCLIFQGAKDAFLPALFVKNGVVSKQSPYLLLIGRGLLSAVRVVVTATLSLAISSLFRNGVAAVGISVLSLYIGNTITSVLLIFGQDWSRYLIFANMDLVAVHDGTTGVAHQSMLTAVIVILLHMAVFLWTAFDSFTRREV